MIEKIYQTPCGPIHYWITEPSLPEEDGPARMEKQGAQHPVTLVFLPGLTVDHRLFDCQIDHFKDNYNVFVWDAPGHASSWPFSMDFTLMDKAVWLDEIFTIEGIRHPVIIGQSMGGYVGQAYAERFPDKLQGFAAIDSAPLQRKYVNASVLWILSHMEPVYRYYPWSCLVRHGSAGLAETTYGRKLVRDMMSEYEGQHSRYAKLAGHGFHIVADAYRADLSYRIPCPAMLLCGKQDKAGFTSAYNRTWHRESGIPLHWIPGAGHNANTDAPELVNSLIDEFLMSITVHDKSTRTSR